MSLDSNIQIRNTEDGSHTLYLPAIDETYHSTHGAVNESLHVFMDAGFSLCEKTEVRVLELGFGTGLNAYLTALAADGNCRVYYTTIEKYPLAEDVWSFLNFASQYKGDEDLFRSLHASAWDEEIQLTPYFNLHKIKADFSDVTLQGDFDVIYYDAFSPDKQPELWTESMFQKLYDSTAKGGVLTTYCAKGTVRRAMQAAGYLVERIPGPKGKREMLRATKV